METQAQIVSVYSRTTSKGVVYDINLSDGSLKQTWKGEIAAALNQYVGGQPVMIRYEIKPSNNPQYPPRETITAFAPPGQMLAPEVQVGGFGVNFNSQPMQAQPMGMQPGVMQQPQQPPIQQAKPRGFDDPNVVIRVVKLSCLEIAGNYVGHLLHGAGPEAAQEGLDLIKSIAESLYGTARSHENAPVTQQYETGPQGQVTGVQPVSGAQVAAGVPGVALGAPQQTSVVDDPVTGSEWD